MNRSIFSKYRSGALAIALALAAFPVSQQAHAHPHEFVTMDMTARFDSNKHMSGMTYVWTFDEFFSAYAIEGQDKNKNQKAEPEELTALLVEIIGNIKDIKYFTVFDKEHVVPEFAPARPISSKMVDGKLRIEFVVPFAKPLDLRGKKLRYAIYDDEFYIAMNYDPENEGINITGAADRCSSGIDRPDPDEEIVAFASSLGKEQSSGGGLGAQFAEWVTLSCK